MLPGADFNKQVYQFNEKKQIWDQNDYEERVKVEAEILVALEALKTSVNYLNFDVSSIQDLIHHNKHRIGANQEDIWENSEGVTNQLLATADRVYGAQNSCYRT